MEKQIRVVWVCHFSDERVRKHLKFNKYYFHKVIRWIIRKNTEVYSDFAPWISNAIRYFETFDDIDLTIVFPHCGIAGKIQYFEINGINYVAFRSEDDNFISYFKERLFGFKNRAYKKNRGIISSIIKKANPQIVHIIGAENPYYSIAALDIPSTTPSIISLQTLVSHPDFFGNYPVSKQWYDYHSQIEKEIIRKSTYIGSRTKRFKDEIWKSIKPDAVFLQMPLALGVDIDTSCSAKEYDFVYFAKDISKAADLAIEVFALAHKECPTLTLNISGAYSDVFKTKIDKRIEELGISNHVFITGEQTTHDNVLRQIKKSKYALLPLKVDLISGTIREAMASGLPVVSTITPSTPKLNEERESILLSEKGDNRTMANNMLRLVNDETLALKLRENAIITVLERYSNECFMNMWKKAYYEIIDNFKNGVPFSNDVISI